MWTKYVRMYVVLTKVNILETIQNYRIIMYQYPQTLPMKWRVEYSLIFFAGQVLDLFFRNGKKNTARFLPNFAR